MDKTRNKTVRLGNLVLKAILSREEYYEKSGDLEEVYYCQVEDIGSLRAKCWYLVQIMKAIPTFFLKALYWRLMMFKNYLKVVFRNIQRQKGYSFIMKNVWLPNFHYRISLGISTFALSGSLAVCIAVFTVSYQAIRAALANPAEALKYE